MPATRPAAGAKLVAPMGRSYAHFASKFKCDRWQGLLPEGLPGKPGALN